MDNQKSHRSFFWPIILIGAGVILLLRNLGVIQVLNLGSLIKLWPLLLIVIGLDILFGRKAPWLTSLIGLLTVAGVIAFLVFAPSLGFSTAQVAETEVFSAPREGASSVEYVFETAAEPVSISELSNSTDLIDATITHRGTMNFDVTGTDHKLVHLSETSSVDSWLVWDLSFVTHEWDIKLAPDLETAVVLDGGSGSINMDLSGIKLTSLQANTGSGSTTIDLPQSSIPYDVAIESGSGSITIALASGTDINLSLDSGSGSVNVSVPSGTGIKVEILDEGSGSLNLPDGLIKANNGTSFAIGTWQTAGYDSASSQVFIKILNQGSGSINIH